MPLVHHLKIDKEPFEAILDGVKTFEIRKNDRDFKVGDEVVYFPNFIASPRLDDVYQLRRRIRYITDFKQRKGYVVFSI